MSTKCRNAPQILSNHEMKECARAVAVMVYRFQPEVYHRIISAQYIAEALGNLQSGQLSTFHVDSNTLKKAFANKIIREALKLKFPGRYDFSRASTAFDVIKSGSSAFLMEYRIIFEMEVVLSKSIRSDIDALSLYIISYYQNHEMQQIGSSQLIPMQLNQKSSQDMVVACSDNNMSTPHQSALQLDRDDGVKKRGRPEIKKEEMNKRLNRMRMNFNYSRGVEKKQEENELCYEKESTCASEIGKAVSRLMKEANVYTEKVNGEECVSIVSGLIIQDLISNCGCPIEKIPQLREGCNHKGNAQF
jgi:hypothetical protein